CAIILVYDQRVPLVCSPIECKSNRSATYLETQPPDWVLSFLEYDSLFLENEPAKVSDNLQFLPMSLP
ncbi:hypothetical protein OH459_20980, partial [Vibrio sp. MM46]|nr:hypothetical protein [Vibrio sp. MM46]